MKVFAIDPGLTGAVAMINSQSASVEDLPVMRDGALAWVDCQDLLRTLIRWRNGQPEPVPMFIERQGARPGQGISSTFKSGVILGSLLACAQAACCQVHLVSAVAWKRTLGLSGDKNVSLDRARLLFPLLDLERKKDHNRAEALLIAYYGSRLDV